MCLLLDADVRAARYRTRTLGSNSCAVRWPLRPVLRLAAVTLSVVMFAGDPEVAAQSVTGTLPAQQDRSAGKRIASFLAGAATGLSTHEAGLVLADGMAASARMDERMIGALVLAPALLDAWRYLHPEARAPRWASRSVKVGLVLLVAR